MQGVPQTVLDQTPSHLALVDLANTSPMDTFEVTQLEAADTLAAYRAARKHGHAQPPTASPVKQALGGD